MQTEQVREQTPIEVPANSPTILPAFLLYVKSDAWYVVLVIKMHDRIHRYFALISVVFVVVFIVVFWLWTFWFIRDEE